MPEIFYSDEHVTLWHGDCLDVLADLPTASIDAVVTDPPRFAPGRGASLPLCDSTVDLIVTGPPYLSLRTRLLQGALIEGDTP